MCATIIVVMMIILVIRSKVLFNNTRCYLRDKVLPIYSGGTTWIVYRDVWESHHSLNIICKICNRSNTYQCINSLKCIPNRRLMDLINDCPFGDDENITEIQNIIFQ